MPVRRTESALKRAKTRKTGKAKLEAELDKLWSLAVKKRDGYKCVRCGKPAVHAHHIFSRRHKRTRWEVKNGIALCYRDHWYWVRSAAPADKQEYLDLIDRISFPGWLARESGKVWKPTIDDLLELKERLKA